MTKIYKTKTWDVEETKRNGEKATVTYVQEYLGDYIKLDINLIINRVYPDFGTGENYDADACKEYLVNKLIDYLQANKKEIKDNMITSDYYLCGYNVLEGCCHYDDSEE